MTSQGRQCVSLVQGAEEDQQLWQTAQFTAIQFVQVSYVTVHIHHRLRLNCICILVRGDHHLSDQMVGPTQFPLLTYTFLSHEEKGHLSTSIILHLLRN